jgi:GMP synthase (glutamine-hydrolysing)
MNIHVLMHVPFEQPGYIEKWAGEKSHNLTFTRFYEPHTLPKLNDFDWLIVMGGPMGVYDEDKYTWLKEEKSFIKRVIDNNKIVLGICLGSQLIADVLGAKIFKNKYKEIGWFKIKTTGAAKGIDIFKSFPEEVVVFHWHGDTYNLPNGAIHLAESDVCKNQAYIYNGRVIGLQFHIEVTEHLINEMLENGSDELKNSEYIQTEDEIRKNLHFCDGTNLILDTLLNNIQEKLIINQK